ncbi:hypothetical protein ACG2LH_18175 [Zhouia sp. PK063]|uniref:hypothetical protein n=1 Tax=Zhouia sp. PK063 TaxID=3373602 RepID=UPI0037B590FE
MNNFIDTLKKVTAFSLIYTDHHTGITHTYNGKTAIQDSKFALKDTITADTNFLIFKDEILNENAAIKSFGQKIWVFKNTQIDFYNQRFTGFEKIFTLVYDKDRSLWKSDTYECGCDGYTATLQFMKNNLTKLHIKIKSSKKNIEMEYLYT